MPIERRKRREPGVVEPECHPHAENYPGGNETQCAVCRGQSSQPTSEYEI
jgi:hypothetical protein